jgi:hypothetical protein
MKKLLLFTFAFGLVCTAFSQDQLYQSGFNLWTNYTLANTPSQWLSSYGVGYPANLTPPPVSKSTDATHLLSSVKLESSDDGGGGVAMGFVLLGSIGNSGPEGGVPFSVAADSIIFDAKYDIQAGDSANVYIILKNGGFPFDMNIFTIGGSQSNWTRMAFKINPFNLVPDSLIMGFTSSDSQNGGEVAGSWIQIDNIRFVDGTTYSSTIPNPSFENWDAITVEEANEWTTLNSYYAGMGVTTAAKTTDSQEGAYAMNLLPQNANFMGDEEFVEGIAIYGTFDSDFNAIGKSFAASPTSMTGYYKWAPVNGATGNISVTFQSGGSVIGGGSFDFTTAQSAYTQFTIPLTLTGAPDTILVMIDGGSEAGSDLKIDNIQFAGGTVGVKQIYLNEATIGVYPNPAVADATLKIALPKSNSVSYVVVNALGQQMESDHLGLMKDGIHTVKLNTGNYSTGVYFVKVKIGDNTMTQKVIVK